MYTEYFGFQKKPFSLTPDPEFLYFSRVHDLALAHLEYGILNKAGFIAVTGEVGSGKTTLLKYLFNQIKEKLDIAFLLNTNLDPQELLEILVKEFELTPKSYKKSDLFECLADHFITQYSKGRRCVIIVDEAQNLPLASFEELRMLSNIEKDDDFIIQIVFVGQPELKEKLSNPSLMQLSQRISVYYHLSPLDMEEVQNYILHRLKVAGYKGEKPLFEDDAVKLIYEFSEGIPRLINLICDMALVYAFTDNLKTITSDIIKKVVEDNELLNAHKKSNKATEPEEKIEKTDLNNEQILHSNLIPQLSKLLSKIEILETRLNNLENSKKENEYNLLYNIFEEERKRNISLERENLLLNEKIKELEREMLYLYDKIEELEVMNKKKRGIFGFGKKNS